MLTEVQLESKGLLPQLEIKRRVWLSSLGVVDKATEEFKHTQLS
jgi:hypothetical protein